jgi:hypothetical protein
MSLGENPVLGIAMASSQAAGYVNRTGNITGWLNELAFVPIDYRPHAPADEWSTTTHSATGPGRRIETREVWRLKVSEQRPQFARGHNTPALLVLTQCWYA